MLIEIDRIDSKPLHFSPGFGGLALARPRDFSRLLQRHPASENLLDKVRREVENDASLGKAIDV